MTDPLITELIEARKAAGLTQRQVADRMHCVQSHVSMLEAGRTDLQLDTLRRWAGALGLRPVWVPETAPAVSEFAAGNGAPRLGEGPADEDAPASDPADVGSDEGRADVARCRLCSKVSAGECCLSHFAELCHECYRRSHFVEVCGDSCALCAEEGLPKILRAGDPAVARTLDVAEATADKARAVGLVRLRPLSDSSEYTCDWGGCNEVASSERFDGSQWLSVCPQHETSTDAAVGLARETAT